MNQYFKPKRRELGLFLIGTALAALAAIATVVLPAFAKPKHSHPRLGCINNEKQLGIAFRGFAIDMGASPMKLPAAPAPVDQPPSP